MVSKEKIDRMVEAREQEEAKLYRSDGSKLYSDEEHASREADTNRRFRAAMDEIDEEAESPITHQNRNGEVLTLDVWRLLPVHDGTVGWNDEPIATVYKHDDYEAIFAP